MTDDVGLPRRRFFRSFANDVVRSAGVAVEAATTLNRVAADAMTSLIEPPATVPANVSVQNEDDGGRGSSAPVAPSGFRLADDRLFVVDERRLPAETVEIDCTSPVDTAHAISVFAIPQGPIAGAVAAVSLALAAATMQGFERGFRATMLRVRATGLASARPESRSLATAIDRVMAVHDEAVKDAEADADEDAAGRTIARAMRIEADRIALETATSAPAMTHAIRSCLPPPLTTPLRVLADPTTALLPGWAPAFMYVVEGGFDGRGSRVAAPHLTESAVDHELIADAAIGSLLSSQRVDAVVVSAERITLAGDAICAIGAYPLAVVAARHGVAFVVAAATSAIEIETDAGALAGSGASSSSSRLDSRFELVPRDIITVVVTQRGVMPRRPALGSAGS